MPLNRWTNLTLAAFASASLAGLLVAAMAEESPLARRDVPAKSLPVPTDVSPGMQKLIAAPLNPAWDKLWKTGEEWRRAADKMDQDIVPTIPAMAERLRVKVEPSTTDGVKVFVVTPEEIPPENRNRLLIHIHGGCYVLFPGEAGATEAIIMAGLEHFKVVSVDYRHRQVTERGARGGRDPVARAMRRWRVRRSRAIRSSPRNEALDSRMMTMPGEESCGGWRSDRGWRQIAGDVWRI